MKTLLLLRHAKSAWDRPVPDHDRPLAPRGRRAAPAMGRHLAARGIVPDAVLCSTAQRTRQTWEGMASELGHPRVEWRREIYEASPSDLLDVVRGVGDGVERLMVVGHNPGLHRLALSLTGSGETGLRQRLREKFPTAALAVLELDSDAWAVVEPGTAALVHYVRPKDLPGADERGL
jgi:phosphohistidine phosphatase